MNSEKEISSILYLDDEKANLESFKFNFRKDYNVLLAGTVREALEIINKNKVKVVISDQRMPDMSGTDFFETISRTNPDIVRILITAYADTDAAMQAINKGNVYRFIAKPLDKNALRVTIENAIEAFDLKRQNNELFANLTNNNRQLESLNSRLRIEIDEHDKSEVAVKQYSDIVQNMQVALCVCYLADLNDNGSLFIVKINQAAEKIIRQQSDTLIGKKLLDAFPVLKEYNTGEILADVVRTGSPYINEEFRIYLNSGEILFFSVKAFNMPNNHVSLLFEDISKRKRIEQAVKENEERYRALFDKSPDGIHLVGTNGEFSGKLVSANPKVLEMLGYTIDELIGKPTDEIMKDLRINEKKLWTEKLMTGETIKYETNFYRKNNSSFPVEVTSSIISLGDQILILGIDRDISERKRSEQLIKESEQKLLNVFNSSSDGIVITDFDFKIIEANQTLLEMIGFKSFDKLKKSTIDEILPSYPEIFMKGTDKIKPEDKISNLEIEMHNVKGNIIPVEINSKIIDHGGKPAILTLVRDITERKTLEKKLFETIINTEEKEREKFAGDLHDEVGPLLSSLKMYISLLAETDDKKKKEYITPQIQTLIKEAITSVREISNDLSPHVLNNYGCVAAINSFIGMKRDFINVAFNQNLENVRFTQSVEIVVYRVVKELINNTIKHAKATNIEIKMYEEDNFIRLLYKDDGVGFITDETVNLPSGSIGLLNIMSRVKTVNGKYKILSSKGSGFTFEMTVPLH
jgi:PAS domain S-box-containing protein